MQVSKWGNSLAVRIPVAVVDALDLHEGDDIEITVAQDRKFEVKKTPGTNEHLKSLRKFRGKMPADFKFVRDEANER